MIGPINKNEKYCLFTNDVETTSLWNNKLSYETGLRVLNQGLPALLDIYRQYDAKATFFFTGNIAKTLPETVKIVASEGHEIASHGMYHDVDKAFDLLSENEQIENLVLSKKILEDICGEEVISFRAPALRVNKHTPCALLKAGYKIDSSISSQRMDMIFSFGSLNKLKWIISPRKPYCVNEKSLGMKGNSELIEIPISSFIIPYIGTIMRLNQGINGFIRRFSEIENRATGKPIVFLIHPNELIDEKLESERVNKRADGYISYIVKDLIRYKLKRKNLGSLAIPLFRNEVRFFYEKNYKFITLKEYVKQNNLIV